MVPVWEIYEDQRVLNSLHKNICNKVMSIDLGIGKDEC